MNRCDWLLPPVLFSVCFLFVPVHAVQAQFEDLAKRLPNSTNSLVMVDAARIYRSDIAVNEGWSQNRQSRFAAGLTAIPPEADKIVLGAHMDWEFMRPNWEAELVVFTSSPNLQDLAKNLAGKPDTISDKTAVALPDDSYIVQLSNNTFGVMAPANRQVVSRWVRQADAELSPYIQAGVAYQDKTADVIIAFDFSDAISEEVVKQKIAASDSDLIKNLKIDHNELAKLLASIRGVMLGITFGTKANGAIRVDFGQDAALLQDIGKPLLLHVLGEQGVMIDEFQDWDVSVEGTTLSMRGTLTYSGLTRIASLVEPPTQALRRPAPKASEQPAKPRPQDMAQATQFYFDSIDKLFADLKRQKRDSRTYGQIGYFYGKYADRISDLPILNVDPQMIDYGQYVSGQLRAASNVIKEVGIRTTPQQTAAATNTSGYFYNPSPTGYFGQRYWGGIDYSAALAARRADTAKIQVAQTNRAEGSLQVTNIVSQIDDAKLKIRRSMTEKYNIEF